MDRRRFGNVFLIEGKNNGRFPFANTLLIDDGVRVLIDPAAGRSKMKAVLAEGVVDIIINSHYHEDHITYNYMFPDADIFFHEADRKGFGSFEGLFEMGVGKFLSPELKKIYIEMYSERFHFLGWEADRFLRGGEELVFGGTRVQVVHLPGHTPGHCGFFFPDIELMFSSDVDLTPFGPWYGDSSGDIDETIESTRKVGRIEAKWYVTSHDGPVYEDVGELVEKYIKVVEDREEVVYENIREPATLEDLARRWIVYRKPRSPEEMYLVGEKAMIAKHLERLIRRGLAVKEGEKYTAL